jgi:hypothetical protein
MRIDTVDTHRRVIRVDTVYSITSTYRYSHRYSFYSIHISLLLCPHLALELVGRHLLLEPRGHTLQALVHTTQVRYTPHTEKTGHRGSTDTLMHTTDTA